MCDVEHLLVEMELDSWRRLVGDHANSRSAKLEVESRHNPLSQLLSEFERVVHAP